MHALTRYEPQLSGRPPLLPAQGGISSPRVSVELLPIGGICGVALELPARRLKDVHLTRRAAENGLNSCFNETLHCLAQEPTTTVLRVAVLEGDKDVAYETCLISSLRPGYRVLHLRSLLGTRIECAVLFVRISLGVEPNNFGLSGEAAQKQLAGSEARIKQLNALIKNSIARQLAISLENQKLDT